MNSQTTIHRPTSVFLPNTKRISERTRRVFTQVAHTRSDSGSSYALSHRGHLKRLVDGSRSTLTVYPSVSKKTLVIGWCTLRRCICIARVSWWTPHREHLVVEAGGLCLYVNAWPA